MTEGAVVVSIEGPTSPVPQQPQVSGSSETTLAALIIRTLRDPSFPIERVDRLHELLLTERDDMRKLAFRQAMANAQMEMEPVRRNAANDQTKSKYATHEAIDRDIRGIYTKNGFSISFDTDVSPKATAIQDYLRVLAYVAHDEGFERTYKIDMPIVTKGPKGNDVMTAIHATGSANSYGKRYLLCDIFNIALAGDDDDGNGGRSRQQDEDSQINDKQVKFITKLIEDTGADKAKLLAHFGVEKIEDLSIAQLREATAACNRRKQQQAQAKEPAKETE